MKCKALKLLLLSLLVLAGTGRLMAQEDSIQIDYPFMDFKNPKQYIIKDIKMEGVKYLDPEILISQGGMTRGDTVYLPGEYLSDAARKLWSQLRFSDIRSVVETEGDSAIIYFYLQERPQVFKWSFDGVKKGEASDLLEKLNLRRGSELSDFKLNTAIETIKRFFKDKSFLNVEVDIVQKNDTVRTNAVDVTFKINKGERVKIGKVDFEGNDAFKDKRLRKALKKTKQKSINIFVSSKFNQGKYDEDKENLIEFYNSKGYRNADILTDSIYKISDNRIGIHFKVNEGDKFYYRNISWLGNSKHDTDLLNMYLGINEGDTYDSKTMGKRLGLGKYDNPEEQSVSSLYQNDGYLMFQMEPQETVVGKDSIDLEIKLIEGKQATVNSIGITGNNRVNDHVIRRELDMRPGELYNRAMLMSTIRRIAQMQHFNAEALMPKIEPVSNELVNISFPLEEQPSDRFEVSGGWGAGMFVGSVGVTLNNISIRNFLKKGAWRPYPHGDNQQLSIRGQTNGSYYKSFSLNFTEPWLGGKKPNSLSVGLYYSDQTDAYYMWQTGNKHFRTIGGSVGIGRRLNWPDRMFTLYTELMYQAYNLKDWDNFLVKNGSSNIIAIRTVLSRNSIDQPIYPRRGSEFSLSVTLTPPYSLFDGKDYKSDKLTENQRYGWIEYHKWHMKADWYYPISSNNNLVLRASAELGFIGSYNKYKPSPFEGYQMGGDGMSGYNLYGVDVVGLRGYENASLTPDNQYSRAYNKYVLEVRYPFILKPSSQIYGLVFAEGGNAFQEVKQFDPFLLKRSLGLGVRLYLPVVGLIGIDWGYGFDKDYSGKKGGAQFHFMIGQQF